MLRVAVTLLCCIAVCHGTFAPEHYRQLEKYLSQYGYLPATGSGTKRSESDLEQATRKLQKFMGLEVSGGLDNATLELINKPRCGVVDVNEFTDVPSNYSTWHKKWTEFPVTYAFENYSPDLSKSEIQEDFAAAADKWASVTKNLKVERVNDPITATFPVKFGVQCHGGFCSYFFAGKGNVLADASFPLHGDVHFDEAETYIRGTSGGINFVAISLHELGHSFGLKHSSKSSAVMYGIHSNSKTEITDDDRAAIQSLYGAA